MRDQREASSGVAKKNRVYVPGDILNKTWLDQRDYRLGKLKFFVNGKLFMTVENFEEIIPRELNEVKEKQATAEKNLLARSMGYTVNS